MTKASMVTLLTLASVYACKQNPDQSSVSSSVRQAENTQKQAPLSPNAECGTLVESKNKIYLQVVSGNSDTNADRLLEPQDGATENILREKAEKMASVCIDADFKKPDPILVKSAAQIRDSAN